jgi:hypothetical protein
MIILLITELSLSAYLQKVKQKQLKRLILKVFTVGIYVLHHQDSLLKKILHVFGQMPVNGLKEECLLQDRM